MPMGSPLLRHRSDGFTVIDAIITVVTCLVVVFIGLTLQRALRHSGSNTPSPASGNTSPAANTGSSSQYAVLAPATVPSKTPECSQSLTFASDGNSGPVTCSNGDLNATEWNSLTTLEPSVMTLGYDATAAQVQSALCADVSANVSNPIEITVYQIASLYYGWHFSSNPAAVLENGTCENVDD